MILSKDQAKLLEKEGIKATEDLVALSKSQIRNLAKKTGLSAKLIDTCQEYADLMRVEGISPEYAHLINLIGIDSVKELSMRNAKNTLEKMESYLKENPKIVKQLPKIEDIENWIEQANILKQKYGKYNKEYWNEKWKKSPIIYKGRALRGSSYNQIVSIDVKTFLKKDDAILQKVISVFNLKKGTFNETALECQKFVHDSIKYLYDELSADCVEYWQFPFETAQSGIGDCEDGAIFMAGLMLNAGIPSWRIKVCAGTVLQDPNVAPSSDGNLGGHCYTIYLADRPDSKRKLEWVILDWCYNPDPDIPIEKKPLSRNGGQKKSYKDVWFTFNDENSWANTAFEIIDDRISKNQKTKKESVLNKIKEIMNQIDVKVKK